MERGSGVCGMLRLMVGGRGGRRRRGCTVDGHGRGGRLRVVTIQRGVILHEQSVGKRIFVFHTARRAARQQTAVAAALGVRLAVARLDVLLLQRDWTVDLSTQVICLDTLS